MKSINIEGGNVCGGWNFFFKINKRDSTFIREMRVNTQKSTNNPMSSFGLIQYNLELSHIY